jgi:hypothetical protein
MTPPTHLLYQAAGYAIPQGSDLCRVCRYKSLGTPFVEWDRPGFTGRDYLAESGEIICDACAFCFSEASEELRRLTKRERPQKMRNYSHIVAGGVWHPLDKGRNREVRDFLLSHQGLPELAIVTETAQKHIIFRGRTNVMGADMGWVQFEETLLWVEQTQMRHAVSLVEALRDLGFSKQEILTGNYQPDRIRRVFNEWLVLDTQTKPHRNVGTWSLVVYIAQKGGLT